VHHTPGQLGAPENEAHLGAVSMDNRQFMPCGHKTSKALGRMPGGKILSRHGNVMRIFYQGISADGNY
jgi:hypothetical protein